jgi:MOSC domain-containing protein YiiM
MPMPRPEVLSVNVGRVAIRPTSKLGRTGIDKHPVAGPVHAGPLGLAGDEVADADHHGGVDQAVYAYAREDLARWEVELGYPLRPGQFGENLTTSGIDLYEAVVGERWRVGTAEFEVSCPRVPCMTFQDFLGEPNWVKRFTHDGRVGTYLRVVRSGDLTAGQEIEVVHRPDHGVTVGLTFAARALRPELLPRLLSAPELPEAYHERARAYLRSPHSVS